MSVLEVMLVALEVMLVELEGAGRGAPGRGGGDCTGPFLRSLGLELRLSI